MILQMRSFHLFSGLFLALLFMRCAAVPMPVTVVPQRGNSFETTVYVGNNGLGVSALYATKHLTVFNATIQRSRILTDSRAYDFGLGRVITDSLTGRAKVMVMLTFGYGKYDAYPFTMGGQQIEEVNSDASRFSFYVNWPFDPRIGFINRISYYWGQSTQSGFYVPTIEKHPFTAVSYEPMIYFLPGKRRHFTLGLGASLTSGKASVSGSLSSEKDLSPSPAYLYLGYRFARDLPPSPTQRQHRSSQKQGED